MTNYWYNDAVFYNIYPLGACNTKRENDYVLTTEGLDRLGDWVEHMVKLGCNALNLGPVFQSRTHGYDTTDYRKLDSRLGTDQQFADLVKNCHRHGIRVVVDGVFNHTGRDFFAFQDIREHRENSRYRDWYQGMNFGGNNPLNDGFGYEAWRGHWELPRLNPHNPEVRSYLFDTVRDWIRRLDIDGIRLDCADCLDFGFMQELRQACLGEKADFWLMGEIIHGDYTRWANGDTLHSVTNYECSKGLYSSHNDGNMHEIAHSLNRQFGPGGIYKGLMLYNFADNHDLNRLADTVKNQEHLATIYTILYAMPGLPSVYYGSEWGIHGVTDRVTDWNLRPQIDIRTAHMDNPALLAHIAKLAGVRGDSEALRHGDYNQVAVSAHQLAFRRSTGRDTAFVLVNCDGKAATMSIPCDGVSWTDQLTGQAFSAAGGKLEVPVPAYSGRILRAVPPKGDAAVPVAVPVSTVPTTPVPEPVPAPQAAPAPTAWRPDPAVTPTLIRQSGPVTETLVAREENIPEDHQNAHPGYEYRRHRLVSGEEGNRCNAAFYEIPAGKAAYPYHYHSTREEVFYILSGTGTLRTPDGERTVSAGEMLFFPTGPRGAHKLINTGSEPLRYLDFDTYSEADVFFYPDSRKAGYSANSEIRVFRLDDAVDYYHGE